MRRPNQFLALLAMLACAVSIYPSSLEPAVGSTERQAKWPTRTIQISISNTLTSTAAGVRAGSDVEGAIKRALASWATAANVTFVPIASTLQSISPRSGGDGISLITIAPTPDNLSIFSEGNDTARTRVFYDGETGAITEADIVINPYPSAPDGKLLEFSTDATPGTYDLESTLAHEIGHLLGLGHSSVIGSTMQASQGLNGTYGLAAITERSLSEVDRIAVRSVYGPCGKQGAIEGRMLSSNDGRLISLTEAHVWIEDKRSGRVIASSVTNSTGAFYLGCVPPANYRALVEYLDGPTSDSIALTAASDSKSGRRAFRSVEINNNLQITADQTAQLNYVLVPPQNALPQLNPRFLGTNGELSTVPIPAKAGTTLTLYVAGDGVDQIPGTGLLVNSPFIKIDPASLTLQRFPGPNNSSPIISFEVTIGASVPPGDYSIRFQSNSGEVAFLAGGISIDPGL